MVFSFIVIQMSMRIIRKNSRLYEEDLKNQFWRRSNIRAVMCQTKLIFWPNFIRCANGKVLNIADRKRVLRWGEITWRVCVLRMLNFYFYLLQYVTCLEACNNIATKELVMVLAYFKIEPRNTYEGPIAWEEWGGGGMSPLSKFQRGKIAPHEWKGNEIFFKLNLSDLTWIWILSNLLLWSICPSVSLRNDEYSNIKCS